MTSTFLTPEEVRDLKTTLEEMYPTPLLRDYPIYTRERPSDKWWLRERPSDKWWLNEPTSFRADIGNIHLCAK